AQLRLPDVIGLGRPISFRRAEHDALVPWLDFERPVLGTELTFPIRLDDEAAVEALRPAKPLGCDLMTDGARHAVGGFPPVVVTGIEWQMGEHLGTLATQLR